MSITIEATCAPVQEAIKEIASPKPSRVWSVFRRVFNVVKAVGIMGLGGCGVVFMALGGRLFPPVGAAMLVCSAVSGFFALRSAWTSRAGRMDRQLDRHEALINKHDGLIDKHDGLVERHEGVVERHEVIIGKHDELLIRHESATETLDGEINKLSKIVDGLMELRTEMRNNLSESRAALKELGDSTSTIEQAGAMVAACAEEMSRAMDVLLGLPAMQRPPKAAPKPVVHFEKVDAANPFDDDYISPAPPLPNCGDISSPPQSIEDNIAKIRRGDATVSMKASADVSGGLSTRELLNRPHIIYAYDNNGELQRYMTRPEAKKK